MINKYVWELYLKSGGRETVKLFEDFFALKPAKDFGIKIEEMLRVFSPSDTINSITRSQFEEAIESFISDSDDAVNPENDDEATEIISPYEDFHKLFIDLAGDESPQRAFESLSLEIVYQTVISSMLFSEYCIPYLFTYSFVVLQRIADEFEIQLPPIPSKRDYIGRFFYYEKLCGALFDFRVNNNLSPAELCAFLYDFASKYIGGIDSFIIKDLPTPKGAFFVGGSKNDCFYTEDSDALTPWQCSPDTRVGDMIVFYVKSPISSICSVWRSVSVGFNDPFFYYYRCSYIGNPVQIKPIKLSEIKGDSVLCEMAIVKKNLQGINGVELMPSEYNRIVELSGADIPRLEQRFDEVSGEYMSEKDVENKLIKPLLEKLGYNNSDYVQQLHIRFGNHNNGLIPDFVLLPQKKRREVTAFAVIEAKLTIPSSDALEDALDQVTSYAKMLNAKIRAVASKEKLWILTGAFDKTMIEVSWQQLTDPNTYKRIEKILRKG